MSLLNKKIFHIHPGLHKTGTTAIQQALKENEAALKNNGYASLILQQDLPVVHRLFNPHFYHDGKQPNFEAAYAQFKQAIRAIPEPHVIISSEDLSVLYWPWEGHALTLKKLLRDFSYEIHLLFYVRRQDKIYESAYLQGLKEGNQNLSFDSFYTAPETSPLQDNLNWYEKIDQYQSILESKTTQVLVYDFLAITQQDIFIQFCRVLGIPRSETLKPSKAFNLSKPMWLLNFEHHLATIIPMPVMTTLKRISNWVVSKKYLPTVKHSLLTSAQREQIISQYTLSNSKLLQQWAPKSESLGIHDWERL